MTRLLAVLPCLIALFVLAGWAFGGGILPHAVPGAVTMNPVAALSILLLGVGACLRLAGGRLPAAGAAIVLAAASLVGVSKLADLYLSTHFDFDTLLFASKLLWQTPAPSSVSLGTAASLVLTSLALWLVARPSAASVIAAQALACCIAVISVLAVAGHLYHLAALYSGTMAMLTAISFLCFAALILGWTYREGLMAAVSDPGPAGRSGRVLLPAAIIVPVVLGWLRQQGEQAGLYREDVGVALMVMLTVLSMTVLIWYNAHALLSADRLRVRAEDEVVHMAQHDFLTGLWNRGYFMDRLTARIAALARQPQASFALIYMDLDGFKQVNDRLGHAAGDALLHQVGVYLKRCGVRQDDLVARIGGDEFAMLLERIDSPDEAAAAASRIVGEMVSQFGPPGEEVPIGISIGIVIASPRHLNSESLMSDADDALYDAKRSGKGRFVVYPEPDRTRSLEHLRGLGLAIP